MILITIIFTSCKPLLSFFFSYMLHNSSYLKASLLGRIVPRLLDRIVPRLFDKIVPRLLDRVAPGLLDRIVPRLLDRVA